MPVAPATSMLFPTATLKGSSIGVSAAVLREQKYATRGSRRLVFRPMRSASAPASGQPLPARSSTRGSGQGSIFTGGSVGTESVPSDLPEKIM